MPLTTMHAQALKEEIENLLTHGMEQVSVKEFYRRYDSAGFRFEPSYTIRQFCRYLTGPRAGKLSPCANMYAIHKASNLSYAHIDLPESERTKFRTLRHSIFAVSRGYILEP
jgi:hypothetical protein